MISLVDLLLLLKKITKTRSNWSSIIGLWVSGKVLERGEKIGVASVKEKLSLRIGLLPELRELLDEKLAEKR